MKYFTNLSVRPVLALIALLLLFSCKKENKGSLAKIDPELVGYIAGFTSGSISNQSNIQISFAQAVSSAEQGQEAKRKTVWL
ncbi:MAG: hypothetical protein HC896_09475 [Bacteroidales bacterium]|nr:hypothetical protein [Bacteroidales bacterium]